MIVIFLTIFITSIKKKTNPFIPVEISFLLFYLLKSTDLPNLYTFLYAHTYIYVT